MIAEKFELLEKFLVQKDEVASRQEKWLRDYRERPLTPEGLATLIAAGESLAASIVTALVLTEDTKCIDYLFYNRDENSDSSRNFRFFFARELLKGLIDSWKNDDLVLSKETLLKNHDTPDGKNDLIEILVLSLAYEPESILKKYRYYSESC